MRAGLLDQRLLPMAQLADVAEITERPEGKCPHSVQFPEDPGTKLLVDGLGAIHVGDGLAKLGKIEAGDAAIVQDNGLAIGQTRLLCDLVGDVEQGPHLGAGAGTFRGHMGGEHRQGPGNPAWFAHAQGHENVAHLEIVAAHRVDDAEPQSGGPGDIHRIFIRCGQVGVAAQT